MWSCGQELDVVSRLKILSEIIGSSNDTRVKCDGELLIRFRPLIH